MIAALLFAALSAQGNLRTVEIWRGATVPAADPSTPAFGYWDTSDTYIDGSIPDENCGGEQVLAAGPNKTILLRFGDLNRVLGPTRHIRKATLVLTIAGGDKPTLKSVDHLSVAWGAGPYFTLGALIKRVTTPKPEKPANLKEKPEPPRWSATWRSRLAGEGGVGWQQAGASGPQDSETIRDATAAISDKEVTIDGLASTLQTMADHPTENFGVALRFQGPCEFFSSRAVNGKPRLIVELESAQKPSGPDLSVTQIERLTASGGQPKDGDQVTYKAHIKNVGSAKAGAFSASWVIGTRQASEFDVPDQLDPGAETTITTTKAYHNDKTDHRTHTVELRIKPKGPDATAANNALCVYENARWIDVIIPDTVARASNTNLVGSTSVADWIQEQVRIFNDTYAAQSRFSFAPEGAKERVSVGHIEVASTVSEGAASVPQNENAWAGSDPAFLRKIGVAAGLPEFTSTNFPAGRGVALKDGGKAFRRGTSDLYPGLIGYGDTRYEGMAPGQDALLYEPFPPPPGQLPLVPTGLLSATDVATLNAGFEPGREAFAMPKTTLVTATDLSGRSLSNVQLDFFQSSGGSIPDGPPTFSLTQSEGNDLLPNRGGFGPFGQLDKSGGNGTFLVRATSNGQTEWAWLKAWQLIDAASRGNTAACLFKLRFDLSSAPLDSGTDLARDRIITDSTNLLPAKIGTLVNGATDREVTLGGKPGDWVEIDLGRDRTIGEVTLLGNAGTFWPKFDIYVYSTGQNPADATLWASEIDWNWAAANRSDEVSSDPNAVSVAYRAPGMRIRFVRIVNRSSTAGNLKAIRVVPFKIAP